MAMAQQLRAEEIEQFLGTVDGVASARLLTSAKGEIDQIYVTADRGTEGRAARRAVVAALVTRFGIPVEPWRVQVAALKQFTPAELPYLRVLRVDETLSAAETAARVQVGWERAGEQRTGTGQARGPAGATHRLRTLAAAAVDAARTVVDPSQRRITVQHVSRITCMDRPMVLVGIAVGTPGGQDAFVGAAFEEEGSSNGAVAAALDAVTKCMLRAAFETPRTESGDRRAHLEAMRRYARSERAAHSEAAPAERRPAAGLRPDAPGSRTPEPSGLGVEEPEPARWGASIPATPGSTLGERPGPPSPGSDPAPAAASRPTSSLSGRLAAEGGGSAMSGPAAGINGEQHGERWRAPAPSASPRAASLGGGVATAAQPDILRDLREIRPEEKGEFRLATHQANARTGAAPRTGRPTTEDEYFAGLIERRTPVHVRCRDGYELPNAVVREVGTYTLVVETDGTTELLYKHAIISVRPAGARG